LQALSKFDGIVIEDKVVNEFRGNRYFPLVESRPDAVFKPQKRDDITEIIKFATKNKIPLIPVSSKWDFNGSTTASQGGIIVDLRGLNHVDAIHEPFEGMNADIEPGVTFEQLNGEARKRGLRALLPLRMPSGASVLSTYYGKNPILESNKHGYHQDWLLLTYQLAIHDGHFIGVGSEGLETSSVPGECPFSPRADIGRMFLGALGAYGIVGRGTCKLKKCAEKMDFLFATGDEPDDLIAKTRDVTLSTEAAQSVLVATPKILAGYLASTKDARSRFITKLPPWTMIISISGGANSIGIERDDLIDAAASHGLALSGAEPVQDMSGIIAKEFADAHNIGDSFDLDPSIRVEFYTTAGKIPRIRKAVKALLKESGVDEGENIGFLASSIELGRTYYCEYDIFHGSAAVDPKSLPNIGKLGLRDLYAKMYQIVMQNGGEINVPRNQIVSELVYKQEKLRDLYESLRVVKYCMDPDNVMHPSIIFNNQGGVKQAGSTST
jgi:hypothetical protein